MLELDNLIETERDLELFLLKNPEIIEKGLKPIGRQITIYSGIIDFLAKDKEGNFVIIEIKNSPLNLKSFFQVLNYKSMFSLERKINDKKIRCIIMGTDINSKTEDACKMFGIEYLLFKIKNKEGMELKQKIKELEEINKEYRQQMIVLHREVDYFRCVEKELKKKLAGKIKIKGYSPFAIFSLNMSKMKQSQKVKISLLLYGRTSSYKYKGKKTVKKYKGILEEVKAEVLAPACFLVPKEHEDRFEFFLNSGNVPFKKREVLEV